MLFFLLHAIKSSVLRCLHSGWLTFRQTAEHLLQDAETAALPYGALEKVLPTKSYHPAKTPPPLVTDSILAFYLDSKANNSHLIYKPWSSLPLHISTVFLHICLVNFLLYSSWFVCFFNTAKYLNCLFPPFAMLFDCFNSVLWQTGINKVQLNLT